MFKIGLYPVGISDTQTMYSGGTWQLMRARFHPKPSCSSLWTVPRELPQRLLAQTPVVGCLGKSACTTLDLFGMALSQSR